MELFFTEDENLNFLIRGMIFEKYKTLHSMELFFTEDENLNFLIRGMIFEISKIFSNPSIYDS